MSLYAALFTTFNIVLLAAAIMDLVTSQVYDLFWTAGIFLSAMVFVKYPDILPENVVCLIIYTAVQEFIMGKVYGRADCHALCSCAMFLICSGQSVEVCIFHFGVSFVLLTVIQSVKHNIDIRGRLKKKVPMVPYIAVGFWITAVIFLP